MAHRRVSPTIFLIRIAAILGMSLTLAVAILAVIGAWWPVAAVSLVVFVPFFFLMRYVERSVQ